MRAAIAMVLVMSITGCAMTRQQKTVGFATGAALTVVGIAAVAVAYSPCDTDASFSEGAGCIVGSAELWAVGLALGALGVGTMMGTAVAPTLESPGEVSVAAKVDPEPVSVTDLAVQARIAAHGGRCREAAALADRIEMIDPTYRYGTFMKDGAVAACLD